MSDVDSLINTPINCTYRLVDGSDFVSEVSEMTIAQNKAWGKWLYDKARLAWVRRLHEVAGQIGDGKERHAFLSDACTKEPDLEKEVSAIVPANDSVVYVLTKVAAGFTQAIFDKIDPKFEANLGEVMRAFSHAIGADKQADKAVDASPNL